MLPVFQIADKVEFSSIKLQELSVNHTKKGQTPVGYTVAGLLGMAGGPAAVAVKCGLTVQTVSKWGNRIPMQHARTVAIMSGLPLAVVRPDMVQGEE